MNHIEVAASRELASRLGLAPDVPPTLLRRSAADQLEAMLDRQFELITLLDLLEADADLEPSGDELDISWPEGRPNAQCARFDFSTEDDEDDGSAEPTLGAREPSLPWVEPMGFLPAIRRYCYGAREPERLTATRQSDWAGGSTLDGEAEAVNEDGGDVLDDPHDGGDDDEPWLGWTAQEVNFGTWYQGWAALDGESNLGGRIQIAADGTVLDECESDPAEHGVADTDALHDWMSYSNSVRSHGFDGTGSLMATTLLLRVGR